MESGIETAKWRASLARIEAIAMPGLCGISKLRRLTCRPSKKICPPCWAGRTNANCWVVDLLFCLDDICWERDLADHDLPEDLHDVLAKMGNALHDGVPSPEIAKNFDCLPEQLLDRVRGLKSSKLIQFQ